MSLSSLNFNNDNHFHPLTYFFDQIIESYDASCALFIKVNYVPLPHMIQGYGIHLIRKIGRKTKVIVNVKVEKQK